MAESTNGNAAGEDASENPAGGANGNAAAPRNAGFNAHDLKELEKFSNLVISKKDDLQKKSDRIEQMGSFGHWWDAKVPDGDKTWYNRVSMGTCTNETVISKNMQKYKTFYVELQTAVNGMRQAARENNVDADEITRLYDRLSEMLEEAESGKVATNSSTLYAIHNEFLESQEKLENMIKRVECVALRQQLKQVTQAWRRALSEINELRREMQEVREDNRGMKEQLDNITSVNEEMARNQQVLLTQNKVITDMLKEFLDRQ